MPYGEILTTAAKWVWKFKILWVFGLLASCSSGGGLRFNYSFNAGSLTGVNSAIPEPFQGYLSQMARMINETPGWFFAISIMLICGAGLIFWLIGVFGKTGLARGAWLADSGAGQIEFGQLAEESQRPFWRVAGITLLVGLPGFAIGLIFVVFAFFGIVSGLSKEAVGAGLMISLCVGIPLLCLMVPVFWFLGILSELAIMAVTGEDLGVMTGIRRGWQLLTRNLGSVILMALLVLVAQIGFGFLTWLILAPLGLGAILGTILTRNDTGLGTGMLVVFGLIAVPIALFANALFQSYVSTIWALVFRRLTISGVTPPQPVYPIVPPEMPLYN
jgi:hypothetical protein